MVKAILTENLVRNVDPGSWSCSEIFNPYEHIIAEPRDTTTNIVTTVHISLVKFKLRDPEEYGYQPRQNISEHTETQTVGIILLGWTVWNRAYIHTY